jgi:hypothetical protein
VKNGAGDAKAADSGTTSVAKQKPEGALDDAAPKEALHENSSTTTTTNNNNNDVATVPGEEQKKEEEVKDNSADQKKEEQKKDDEVMMAEDSTEETTNKATTAATTTDANSAGQQKTLELLRNDEVDDDDRRSSSSSSDGGSSSFFANLTRGASSSIRRSGQKVESSADPKAAVIEFLSTPSSAAAEGVVVKQQRVLTVESKVTASLLEEEGDSGPAASKLIHGHLVTVSNDPCVYIVWIEESSTGVQQYVEPFDGGRKTFIALLHAGAVKIPGTSRSSASSASSSSPEVVVDSSTTLPASSTTPSAAADSGLSTSPSSSSSSAESSNSSSAGGGANKTSTNGNNGVVHDLTEEQQPDDSPDNKKKNAPLSKEEASTFMATGVISQRLTSAYESDADIHELLATGLISLAIVQELFAKRRDGVQSLGVSAQGGGDIALTGSSVKSAIAPFLLEFILNEKLSGRFGSSNIASIVLSSSSSSSSIDDLSLSRTLPIIPPPKPSTDEEVSRMFWIGGGAGEEVREVLLQLNQFGLTNYMHIHMTDIDRDAVVRFNSSRVSLPNVTYSLVDDNSLGFHMVPGGLADIVYTTFMNGPYDYLCVLLSAVKHMARYVVSFQRNLDYLAPVMKGRALVAKRLGTVNTTGGTSFQLFAVEVYDVDRKVR